MKKSLLEMMFHTDEERNEVLDSLYDIEIGASIIQARTEGGLNQKQLAEALDVKQPYLSRIENGVVPPSHKRLKQIARVLKARLISPKLIIESLQPISTQNYKTESNALETNDRFISMGPLFKLTDFTSDSLTNKRNVNEVVYGQVE